jgi:hypothetical protein
MKIKTIVAAALLALSPGLAFASCFGEHTNQQAMSCGEGMVWDAATQSCTEQVSS